MYALETKPTEMNAAMKRSAVSVLIATFACALLIALPASAFAEEVSIDQAVDASAATEVLDNASELAISDSETQPADAAQDDSQSVDETVADAEVLADLIDADENTDGQQENSVDEGKTGENDAIVSDTGVEAVSADSEPVSDGSESAADADEPKPLVVEPAAVTTTTSSASATESSAGSEGSSESASNEKPKATVQVTAQAVSTPKKSATKTAATPKASNTSTSNPAYAAGFRDGHQYLLASGLGSSRVLTISGSNVVSAAITRTSSQFWKAVFTSDGYVMFLNAANGQALDVSGANASMGANVGVYSRNNTKAQKWLVQKSGSSYTISSALSTKSLKLVLDVEGASTADGANVQLYASNGTKAQSWKKTDVTEVHAKQDAKAKAASMPKGTYALASSMGSTFSLTVSGSNVVSSTYKGAAAQKWTITVGSDGYATVKNANGRVLDVAGAVAVNGANVQVYQSNGTRAQKWIVTKNSNNTYTLESALWPNLVLDVAGAAKNSGTNVQLYSSNATKAQRWDARATNPKVAASDAVAEGWYVLWTSKDKKLCLDIAGAATANGTKLQLYAGNNTPAQRFHIVKSGNYYRIDACNVGGKRIDFDSGKVVPGTKVQIWESESKNSLFSFKKTSSGTYLITNVASGLCLGTAGSAKSGSAVQGRDAVLGGRIGFVLDKRAGLLDEGTYSVRTTLSGSRALSVVDGSWSSGAKLQTSSYDGGLEQKWHVYAVKNKQNTYTIENLGSGLKLSGASNARATQSSAHTTTQQWVPSADGSTYTLTCVANKKALDVSGASSAEGTAVMNWTSNGSAAQKWNLKKVADVESGIYEIRLASDTGKALDEDTGSSNVQVWSVSEGWNQRWYYDKKSGTLVNLASGKALDVAGADKTSGTNVQVYESNGTGAQKWKITYAGSGKFKVTSSLGSTLVLSSAGTGDGSNVTSSTDSKTNSQRWRLKECDIVVSDAMKKNLKGIDLSGVKGVGIDVSAWQGTINWLAVKNAGVDFAIIRVGHGTGISDTQLAANVKGCLTYGIPFGLYYYSTATNVSGAKAEANHAINMMKSAGVTKSNITYAVYYDLEESSMGKTSNRTLLANMTSAFLGVMKNNGYKTGVYANLNWWTNYLTDPSFNNYDRWVAQWHVSHTTHPGPYTFWQIHSEGTVPGISGRVDIDVRY